MKPKQIHLSISARGEFIFIFFPDYKSWRFVKTLRSFQIGLRIWNFCGDLEQIHQFQACSTVGTRNKLDEWLNMNELICHPAVVPAVDRPSIWFLNDELGSDPCLAIIHRAHSPVAHDLVTSVKTRDSKR